MILNQLSHLGFGFAVSMLGALPFGLVNLTVVDAVHKQGPKVAFNISHGAAAVEVLFGLIAIYTGSIIQQYINDNAFINFISIAILGIAGLYFLIKKSNKDQPVNSGSFGFLKGMLLNIISIQVLLFWLVAVAVLSSKHLLTYDLATIITFALGIWIGKMTVLWLYIAISNKMFSKSGTLSRNMNKIIGIVLMIVAFIQILKI